MIIIRHLTGPRAGSEDRPDPKLDRIVFGRRTSCEVTYPPEETIVAREHFALVRKPPGPAGHWTIELFGEPYVTVDGIAAEPDQRLPADAVIELGRRGGPSFRVHVEPDAADDNLPMTTAQEHAPAVGAIAAQARSSAQLARRIGLAGLATAALVGVAVVYVRLTAPQAGIGEAVRAQLLRSAWLVKTPDSGGTAWPIGPHTLATNAHVGALFGELKPGEQMTVRSPGLNGKVYEVSEPPKQHPGFKAFQGFLGEDKLRSRFADLAVPGYDVSILTVKEDLPQDAILRLATLDELRKLEPGTELASAGYPIEGVVGRAAQEHGATPEFHTGTVTGLTDFFFLPADFDHSQLIHHSVPSAGGASGSPIVDASGHVVALLSAGNSYNPPNEARVPSGVLINYGQRVDMLSQLLAGTAQQEISNDEKYWTQQFGVFPSGIDLVDKIIASKIKDAHKDASVDLVKVVDSTANFSEVTRVSTAGGGFQRQVQFPVPVTGGTDYVFIGFAPQGASLQLWVFNGDQPVAHAGTPNDNPSNTFAPWIAYKSPADGKLSVWLINPKDQEAGFTFRALRLDTKAAGAAPPKGGSG